MNRGQGPTEGWTDGLEESRITRLINMLRVASNLDDDRIQIALM